jgi:hypothetical protein
MLGDDDRLARGDGFDVADVFVEFDCSEAAHENLQNNHSIRIYPQERSNLHGEKSLSQRLVPFVRIDFGFKPLRLVRNIERISPLHFIAKLLCGEATPHVPGRNVRMMTAFMRSPHSFAEGVLGLKS